jgi:hypothetical protein
MKIQISSWNNGSTLGRVEDRTIPLNLISLWVSWWHSWHLNEEKIVPLGQENQRVDNDLKCE